MVASVGDTLGKVDALASRLRQLIPTTTLSRAEISGNAAASTLPNAASSTMTATPKPIASLAKSAALGRASSPSGPP
jgi:hypothetical protein